eukprot:TRINITY_DN12808_c0_g1_i2.p1 TRINITY_DN12808_c0_g1~~TRINITY_DN12808_c0_g1_i2.p1  ORF type:complete len:341 (+),score=94.30 TRINITY_DN12808_c0_g1_i2:51-1025(+)
MMNKQVLLLMSAVIGSSATVTIEKGWIDRRRIHWSVAPQLSGPEGTMSVDGSIEYLNLPAFATDYDMFRSDMSTESVGWGTAFRATCSSQDSSGDCHIFYSLGSKEPSPYKRKLIAHGFEEGSCAPTTNSLLGTHSSKSKSKSKSKSNPNSDPDSMTTFYLRLPVGHQIEFFVLTRQPLLRSVVFSHQDEADWVCIDKSLSECSVDLYPADHIHADAPLCVWSGGVGCQRNWCPVTQPTSEEAPGDDVGAPEDCDGNDSKDGKGCDHSDSDDKDDDDNTDSKNGDHSDNTDNDDNNDDNSDKKKAKKNDGDDDDNDDKKGRRHR